MIDGLKTQVSLKFSILLKKK